jgi:hypothetical protein
VKGFRHEGQGFGEENLLKVQDHQAQGSSADNLRKPQAQAAPGLKDRIISQGEE